MSPSSEAMSEPVDLVPFETTTGPAEPTSGAVAEPPELDRLQDVPVELSVELGRTRMTIGETLALGPGSIVALNRLAGEPVDLLVNGTPIARGEVVVIDDVFGLRVTQIVESGPVSAAAAASAAAPVEAPIVEQVPAAEPVFELPAA